MILSSQKKPLTVVHIHGSDAGGGAEILAHGLHRELLSMGVKSRMLVGEKRTDDETVTEIPKIRGIPGIKRASLHLERLTGLQYLYAPGLRYACRMLPGDVDLVHVHSLYGKEGYADVGVLPLLSKRFPIIITLHDMWMLTGHCGYATGCDRWHHGCGKCPDLKLYPPVRKDATRWNQKRKRYSINRSTGIYVVPVSRWLAERIRKSPVFQRVQTRSVLNAVDTTVFRPSCKQINKSALDIPPASFVVLLIANQMSSPWKGIADGIKALNLADRSNLFVLLVGKDAAFAGGALRAPYRAIGHTNDRKRLADLYGAADILLMPSRQEAFGLVAAEAMACGTPVVGYAEGGIPEVVGGRSCGLLVPTGDIAGLVRCLRMLTDSPDLRKNMGSAAAGRIAKHFGMPRLASDYVGLYQTALRKRNP